MTKYKTTFIRYFLFAFFLCLVGCSDDQPQLPPLKPDDVIVAFGDSLTVGKGVAPEYSYPAVLSKLSGFKVINAGVNGETTAQSIKRLPDVLKEYKPSLVVLCIGGNDILRKKSRKMVADNLDTLIRLIKIHDASVVLLAVPEPGLTLAVPEFFERIAKENDVPINTKLMRKLLKSSGDKSDTVHLNKQGYRKMAEGVYAFLQQVGAISS